MQDPQSLAFNLVLGARNMHVHLWNTSTAFSPQSKSDLITQIKSYGAVGSSQRTQITLIPMGSACFIRGGRNSICGFLDSRPENAFQGLGMEAAIMTHITSTKRYTVVVVYARTPTIAMGQLKRNLAFQDLQLPRFMAANGLWTGEPQLPFRTLSQAIRQYEAAIVRAIGSLAL